MSYAEGAGMISKADYYDSVVITLTHFTTSAKIGMVCNYTNVAIESQYECTLTDFLYNVPTNSKNDDQTKYSVNSNKYTKEIALSGLFNTSSNWTCRLFLRL